MTEIEQNPEFRRSGKVIQMNLALKDRPCETVDDLASLIQSLHPETATYGKTVQFAKDAAEQLQSLEQLTGQSAETVLSMALGLLETLVLANQEGRQMMLVSRFGFPLSKVVLPS